MALWDSATCLQHFRDQFKRPSTDAAWEDAVVYRFLSRAQQQVMSEIIALFPRLLMGAPHAMETTDNGLTYHSTVDDRDGNPIYPFGHAEVYAESGGDLTRELYGSTYGGYEGDVVFEGNRVRIPQRKTSTFTGTLYLRCVQMPDDIDASTAPILQPPFLRELIVYRALVLAANAGAQRDPRPYEDLYQTAWRGPNGTGGYLTLLATQYARSQDSALAGITWWRWWVGGGGRLAA